MHAAHPTQFFWKYPLPAAEVLVRFGGHKIKSRPLCQAFLVETVETGTKNRCVIEATHVLRRKLRKD